MVFPGADGCTEVTTAARLAVTSVLWCSSAAFGTLRDGNVVEPAVVGGVGAAGGGGVFLIVFLPESTNKITTQYVLLAIWIDIIVS